MGEHAESKRLLEEIADREKEIKDETWITPNCLHDIGEAVYHEGDIEKAEAVFKKAATYKNYDFQDIVYGRINAALETIKYKKKVIKRNAGEKEESDDEKSPEIDDPLKGQEPEASDEE